MVKCDAGDLILWDSRTIHGGKVGSGLKIDTEELARLSFTVCYTKKENLTPDLKQNRIKAFENQISTTHWPAECEKKYNMREKRKNIVVK